MADQVSRMPSGGLSASFMRSLMNFLAWSGGCQWSQCERDEVDVWISVDFGLLSSLGHVAWAGADCCNEGPGAGKRRHNGNIEVRGRTVEVEDKIHTRMLPLSVHDG